MTSGGIRDGPTARNACRCSVGSRTGQPVSPCQAGSSIEAGSRPCASMSVVIVSGPIQVIRAGQSRTADRVTDLGHRQLGAPRHLPGGPGLGRGRGAKDRLGPEQRLGDDPVRVRGDDDDRQRATRPGEVREPANAGLAERVGDGALGGGREDDGRDRHAWPMWR